MTNWMRRVAEYNRRLGEHPSRSRRVVVEPWRATVPLTVVFDRMHITPVREGWWASRRRRLREWWNPWPSIWADVHGTGPHGRRL